MTTFFSMWCVVLTMRSSCVVLANLLTHRPHGSYIMVLNGVIIGGGFNTGIPTSGVFFSTALASGIFTVRGAARAATALRRSHPLSG